VRPLIYDEFDGEISRDDNARSSKSNIYTEIDELTVSRHAFLASTVRGAQLPGDSITPGDPRDRGCRSGSLEPLGALGLVFPEDGGGDRGVADGPQNMSGRPTYIN